jgi:pimeloyl-ACP methyl ester carboxylesterase
VNIKNKTTQKLLAKIWFSYLGAIIPRTVATATIKLSAKPKRYLPKAGDIKLIENSIILNEVTNEYNVNGYSWGNNNQDVALLLHGWNSHALSMRNFIKPLLEKNYRVITFDAPGHGKSISPNTTLVYKKLIGDLIDKYKPKTIIAHSAGAIYALIELKTKMNDKFKNIVTIGMPLNGSYTIDAYLKEYKMHKTAQKHFWQKVESKLHVNFQDLDLRKVYADKIDFYGIIVHDVNDTTIPYSHAEELHKLWPKSQLVTTTGWGHTRILKNNEAISKVINKLHT